MVVGGACENSTGRFSRKRSLSWPFSFKKLSSYFEKSYTRVFSTSPPSSIKCPSTSCLCLLVVILMVLPNLKIANLPIPFSPCRIRPFSVFAFTAFRLNLSGVAGLSQCFLSISAFMPHPSSSIIILEVAVKE